jgi:hypothetical protein
MSELLVCRRGMVVKMEGHGGIPGKVKLEGFEPLASIIIAPAIGQRVNVQFQTSLKKSVYVYVFGDQMGNVVIHGIAFAGLCKGNDSGLKDVFNYYKEFRASVHDKPVTVTFGEETISGFLMAMDMRSKDPDYMTVDFALTISSLPKEGSE